MLTARHGEKKLIGPRIPREEGRALSEAGELRCPCCDAPVIFRAGARKLPHFAHKPGAGCPLETDPDYRNESQLHLETKLRIHDWLSATLPGARVELEAAIPETGQRSDVLAFLEDGRRVALEVQCTQIAGEEWRRRHAAYAGAGITDVWLLVGTEPRFTMIPGAPRHRLPPTFRFQFRDLAATVLHETGELLYMLEPGGPLASALGLEGVCAIQALAAHHKQLGAGRWADRPFRTTLALSGAYLHAAALDLCRIEGGALFVGDRHRALAAEAVRADALASGS